MKEIKDLWLKTLKDLQKLSWEELKKEWVNSKKRLFELHMKLQAKELKQTHLIKFLRRYIAKINTVAVEK